MPLKNLSLPFISDFPVSTNDRATFPEVRGPVVKFRVPHLLPLRLGSLHYTGSCIALSLNVYCSSFQVIPPPVS